jgi:hypothetical protein
MLLAEFLFSGGQWALILGLIVVVVVLVIIKKKQAG